MSQQVDGPGPQPPAPTPYATAPTPRQLERGRRRSTAAVTVLLVLTAADVSGFSPGTPGFSLVLYSFTSQVDLGRALLVSLLLVLLSAALAVLANRISTVAWAAVCALLALLPLSLGGHAAGTSNHMNAVDSLALRTSPSRLLSRSRPPRTETRARASASSASGTGWTSSQNRSSRPCSSARFTTM